MLALPTAAPDHDNSMSTTVMAALRHCALKPVPLTPTTSNRFDKEKENVQTYQESLPNSTLQINLF